MNIKIPTFEKLKYIRTNTDKQSDSKKKNKNLNQFRIRKLSKQYHRRRKKSIAKVCTNQKIPLSSHRVWEKT